MKYCDTFPFRVTERSLRVRFDREGERKSPTFLSSVLWASARPVSSLRRSGQGSRSTACLGANYASAYTREYVSFQFELSMSNRAKTTELIRDDDILEEE